MSQPRWRGNGARSSATCGGGRGPRVKSAPDVRQLHRKSGAEKNSREYEMDMRVPFSSHTESTQQSAVSMGEKVIAQHEVVCSGTSPSVFHRETEKESPQVGGRLRKFAHKFLAKAWKVPVCELSNQWKKGRHVVRPVKREFLVKTRDKVREWENEGVIEQATDTTWLHALSVVPKKDNKVRVCLDCRPLNDQINVPHVKYESLQEFIEMIPRKGWISVTDIQDAYVHVPIPERDRDAFGFSFLGKKYRFRAMPFGFCLAPAIFTKILRPLAAEWRKKGVKVLVYLDDIAVVAATKELCQQHTQIVRQSLEEYGFLLSHSKCTEPKQKAVVLGFRLNTTDHLVEIPADKKSNIKKLVSRMARRALIPWKCARRILGKLRALALVVPEFRVRTMELLRAVQSGRDVRVTTRVAAELIWWATVGINMRRAMRSPELPTIRIETDASNSGWGASCPMLSRTAHGRWSKVRHINVLELEALCHALRCWGKVLSGRQVLCYVDSMVAFHYIRKKGGCKYALNEVVLRIMNLATRYAIVLLPRYIPTHENVVADRLSRRRGMNAVSLPTVVWDRLQQKWGPFSMDLFADSDNAKLGKSCNFDQGGDALTDPWPTGTLYAFPPPKVMTRLLARIRREQRRVVIVAPLWPSALWWPELMRLSQATWKTSWHRPRRWSWIACLIDCETPRVRRASSQRGNHLHRTIMCDGGDNSPMLTTRTA